ncbi:cell division protein FtsQ/DivIB [Robertkochia aurantiaca]|uniref:cell division protein FtsQ/DivIB n=1 Tax=Robertkochia aurantiaca TaxID=2873700 RepID=UPI001CCAAA4C|nr:cell division protein FtsQ/DivIB [Robertkochia sp. 3YJGBD-33]
MKKYWIHIRLTLVVLLVAGLYSFTNIRNMERKLDLEPEIRFEDGGPMFITPAMVNKLLIQKAGGGSGVAKEKLVLEEMESALNAHEMIRHADVYIDVDGRLGVKITQRIPVARVSGDRSFYIDSQGKAMPLSPVYSARVPLVTGKFDENQISEIFSLAAYIDEDDFLKKNVIGIHRKGKDYELRFRNDDFVLDLGTTTRLEEKFNNFKAFYKKALKDNKLSAYKEVNLKYDNQVVCTKK